VAARHGCAPIAASTHPFARWLDQRHTDKERYDSLGRELQATARRLLICGMHVHVGIEDEETRIDLMSQFAYFLPHLLALSCSSPFWEGENTGLKSFPPDGVRCAAAHRDAGEFLELGGVFSGTSM
jgi:glutamate---cysteine ligase / carboxylate-amine ligase